MPQQILTSVENNFTKGLITEATGLNFPESAATDTDNCVYTITGSVFRRAGIDYEDNFVLKNIARTNTAISTYKWNNAGGDGVSQIVVTQVGPTLYFYKSSAATEPSPLSAQVLISTVDLSFYSIQSSFNPQLECTFADGNGYLFVFHPNCSPIYCTFSAGAISSFEIVVQIRDLTGLAFGEGSPSSRPSDATEVHQYNLMNQGWTAGPIWNISYSNSWVIATGVTVFTVPAGVVGITPGQTLQVQSFTGTGPGFTPIPPGTIVAAGAIISYVGTSLTVNITSVGSYAGGTTTSGAVFPLNVGNMFTFKSATGVYPSNSDVWWYFKNASGVFDPTTTVANITLAQAQAPRGSFTFNAFYINRSIPTGLNNLTIVSTTRRPTNGCWFQGRIWYAGTDATQPATGNAPFYTWTENIYFSQVVDQVEDFGKCYQENDPTSENLFDLLPTDGGVITIQGSGPVYKLFPIQNGLLVFAANGVWFITGSQGIGFSATDYTITRISSIESLSCTSFVNVNGLPYFWNEEGIYAVEPQQGGGLAVNSITVSTILSFYEDIPLSSKRYARGSYNPIDYTIQWIYRDIEAVAVDDRYTFNRILNYSTYNKAFSPYSIDISPGTPAINGILYVQGPGGVSASPSVFKYFCSSDDQFTFAEERDDVTYLDWDSSGSPTTYESYFVTGYKLRGQAIKKFQPQYIQIYSNTNGVASSYRIKGIWDYANSGDSGKWTNEQLITNGLSRFNTVFRRHKIRGSGFTLQFKITSVNGMPFDIIGWAIQDTVNQGT